MEQLQQPQFPAMIVGLDTIARVFRVRRETAKRWYREGAPIKLVEGVYRADYHALWAWIPDDGKKQENLL